MWQIVENSWISDQDCQSVDHRGGEPYKTVGRERLTCPTINPSSRLMHVVVDRGTASAMPLLHPSRLHGDMRIILRLQAGTGRRTPNGSVVVRSVYR